MREIRGIFGAPVTPWTRTNQLDEDALKEQIDFLVEGRAASAIAYPMHMSESATMTEAERMKAVQIVIDRANGKIPIVSHVSWGGTDESIRLAKHAKNAGADAVVCTPPYEWAPSPAGIKAHYEKLLDSVDINVFAYNTPVVVRAEIPPTLPAELASRYENFIGLKDASLSMSYFTQVLGYTSKLKRKFILVTNIEHLVPSMAIGGSGAFSALAVVFPNMIRELYSLCAQDRFVDARPLQYKVTEVLHLLGDKMNATVKAIMEMRGRKVGIPRLPILPLSEGEKRSLVTKLRTLEVWETEPWGPEKARRR